MTETTTHNGSTGTSPPTRPYTELGQSIRERLHDLIACLDLEEVLSSHLFMHPGLALTKWVEARIDADPRADALGSCVIGGTLRLPEAADDLLLGHYWETKYPDLDHAEITPTELLSLIAFEIAKDRTA